MMFPGNKNDKKLYDTVKKVVENMAKEPGASLLDGIQERLNPYRKSVSFGIDFDTHGKVRVNAHCFDGPCPFSVSFIRPTCREAFELVLAFVESQPIHMPPED